MTMSQAQPFRCSATAVRLPLPSKDRGGPERCHHGTASILGNFALQGAARCLPRKNSPENLFIRPSCRLAARALLSSRGHTGEKWVTHGVATS